MVELRQQVTTETTLAEHGIPFSKHIMMEELSTHFRTLSHLSAYDGITDPAEHICKFENATEGIKCHVFLTTLTNSAQQWFGQLLVGSIRSFAKLSSLFQHQFSSSKKYQKSVISLFRIKQEDNETLRACVPCFKTTILEVRRSSCDRCRVNKLSSSTRSRGEPRGRFNPLDLKCEQYTPLITSTARILMAIYQHLCSGIKAQRKVPNFQNIFAGFTESMGMTLINVAS
ncbi:UNVERIFIED_CONTAM: hypothetical protein Sangu_2768300 [Sesamum angustifolium]|uniref:Retrotransposon gag domain-containing protein n=1 Tax=Sesamum angustifolium TaxID=2727405 RepID=A0AAW2ITD9_9LAMI